MGGGEEKILIINQKVFEIQASCSRQWGAEMKIKNYKEMKDNHSEAINTRTHYEKKKNYDSTGFKK